MAEDITLDEKERRFDAAQAPELTELTAIRMLPSMVESYTRLHATWIGQLPG
jgi:hypothetical protein